MAPRPRAPAKTTGADERLMTMRNSEMHVLAALGAAMLSAALIVPTVWFTEARAAGGDKLEDMEVIEASLAYKKPDAPKQPQKPTTQTPEVKPQGVSRDDTHVSEHKDDK